MTVSDSPAATESPQERRRHPRVVPLLRKPVEIQIMGSGFLEVLITEDISIGGVGVRVAHGFRGYDLKEEVDLVVTLPGARPFLTRGIIKHRRTLTAGHVFGVQFLNLGEQEQSQLIEYVDRLVALGRLRNSEAPR